MFKIYSIHAIEYARLYDIQFQLKGLNTYCFTLPKLRIRLYTFILNYNLMKYISRTDLKIVARNSGILMVGIGVMCLIPLIVDLIYLEFDVLSFIVPGAISIGLGYLFMKYFNSYTSRRIRLKHGMMISSFAWFWAGLIGGIVITLSTNIPIIDGIFESVSALTGTGITIFENVEILPYSILFFRALEQWIGGLGVIVVMLRFITPGSISSRLYQSEARDERLKPSIKATIKETLKIYGI